MLAHTISNICFEKKIKLVYYNVEIISEAKNTDVCLLWGERNCRGLISFTDYKFKVWMEV